jgi:hypothetical protein
LFRTLISWDDRGGSSYVGGRFPRGEPTDSIAIRRRWFGRSVGFPGERRGRWLTMSSDFVLSESARSTARVLLLTVVAVEYDRSFMLRVVRGKVPMTPFQKAFWPPPLMSRPFAHEDYA